MKKLAPGTTKWTPAHNKLHCESFPVVSGRSINRLTLHHQRRKHIYYIFILEELGHKQKPIQIQLDNDTTVGFANQTINKKLKIDQHAILLNTR